MQTYYLGFDDTDDKDAPMGTGRLVREFVYSLPQEYKTIGVVRHQLPRLDGIPYTSNNSSACAIIETDAEGGLEQLRELAMAHLDRYCAPGSDPGLCLAREDRITEAHMMFGQSVTGTQVTQLAAMDIARDIELYGLGGTNDGIIGACAAVGLTKYGWCGRFIEYGALRSLGSTVTVGELAKIGIRAVSVERDPLVPLPDDTIVNAKWIRPSLWGGNPVLQVKRLDKGTWETAHGKRKKKASGTHDKKGEVTRLCNAV